MIFSGEYQNPLSSSAFHLFSHPTKRDFKSRSPITRDYHGRDRNIGYIARISAGRWETLARIYRINFIVRADTDCSVTRAALQVSAANEWATVQGHEQLQQIERAPDSPLSFFLSPFPLITN